MYIEGILERLAVEGSKSQPAILFLRTEDFTYRLRREGGDPFYDPRLEGNAALERLYGQRVMVRGHQVGKGVFEIDDRMIEKLERY